MRVGIVDVELQRLRQRLDRFADISLPVKTVSQRVPRPGGVRVAGEKASQDPLRLCEPAFADVPFDEFRRRRFAPSGSAASRTACASAASGWNCKNLPRLGGCGFLVAPLDRGFRFRRGPARRPDGSRSPRSARGSCGSRRCPLRRGPRAKAPAQAGSALRRIPGPARRRAADVPPLLRPCPAATEAAEREFGARIVGIASRAACASARSPSRGHAADSPHMPAPGCTAPSAGGAGA